MATHREERDGKREILLECAKFRVERVTLQEPNGDVLTREVVIHPGAVVIVPSLDDDHLVLIRNTRFAVGKTLWELPAGTLEQGESPESCALRELEEETGYGAQEVRPLTEFYTTPGFCNERMYAFVAKSLRKTQQSLDPTEKIVAEVLDVSAVHSLIVRGEIQDAKTLATLLLWFACGKP